MTTSWGPSSYSKMSCNCEPSHLALRDVVLNNHFLIPCSDPRSDFTHRLLGQKHLLHFERLLHWRLSMEPSIIWLSLWLPALPSPSSWERQDEIGFVLEACSFLHTAALWKVPLLELTVVHTFLLACPSPLPPADLDASGSKMTWAKCTPSSDGLPNQRACFPSFGGKNEHYTEQYESIYD